MPNSALRVRSSSWSSVRNDIENFWLPFTANRAFKARPRLIVRAKNMHYYTSEGRAVLDATAGLWCCNAGHSRDSIVAAIQAQAAELDFAPPFQFAHPIAFETASRLSALAPGDLNHVFFCNSGSEAAQGCDIGLGTDGWCDRTRPHPRCLHVGSRSRDRIFSRLHLFGASARLCRGDCNAGSLSRRAPV